MSLDRDAPVAGDCQTSLDTYQTPGGRDGQLVGQNHLPQVWTVRWPTTPHLGIDGTLVSVRSAGGQRSDVFGISGRGGSTFGRIRGASFAFAFRARLNEFHVTQCFQVVDGCIVTTPSATNALDVVLEGTYRRLVEVGCGLVPAVDAIGADGELSGDFSAWSTLIGLLRTPCDPISEVTSIVEALLTSATSFATSRLEKGSAVH